MSREIPQNECEDFKQKHSEVKRWLRKVESDYTRNGYVRQLIRYCEATEKTPSELIELKKNSKDHEAEDLLDDFIEEATKAGTPNSTIWNVAKAVKSFYKWNYSDLSRGAGKISRIKIKAYRTPDKETLLKFMEGMQIRDKALVSFMACTGIAEGSIPKLKWKHVQEINEKDIPHIALTSVEIKGQGRGKYENIEQHTFLTPHAKRMFLTYKEWRERKEGRALTPEDYLFTTLAQPYRVITLSELGAIFSRHSKEIGIKFSPHDLRRFVQTALETARLQPNWIKKILRHKVSGEENPYSQPKIEALRDAYRTALPYLDLSEKPIVNELDITKKSVLASLRSVLSPEAYGKLEPLVLEAKSTTEINDAIDKHRTGRTGLEPIDCQLVITEDRLEDHLKHGFRFVATLPSGKILVSNEE
jgi:integrase